jgi:hypothetical protein
MENVKGSVRLQAGRKYKLQTRMLNAYRSPKRRTNRNPLERGFAQEMWRRNHLTIRCVNTWI